jgi:AcrR family transcriptional regulator
MFNELGPDNVSTVQILKALQISPGNLYYYYRNKEEIIREIYEQMITEYRENWNIEEMQKPDFNSTERIINNLRIFFKYRFLMNNMSALANNDAVLRERFIRIAALRQSELGKYFRTLEEQGMMDFGQDPETIPHLVSVLWFLGEFWLMNKELKIGKINDLTKEMELEYMQMNTFLTNQFITEKGREAFAVKQHEFLISYL